MQLTGKQIVENGIVIGACEEGIQQQGVDVRIAKISIVGENCLDYGFVPVHGKTVTPMCENIPCELNTNTWRLKPGYYEIEFLEGCNIPANAAMAFKTRSSLVRCGAEVRSGQFDGGFKTKAMGAFLKVELPIEIEKHARVAQMIVTETYPVDEEHLYDGQWQGDKQRG